MNTNVKQTKNSVTMIGVLSEKNLQLTDGFVKNKDGEKIPCDVISGLISVKTERETVLWRVYAAEKKKNGEHNVMYDNIEKLYSEMISLKEASTRDDVEASIVKVRGNLDINDYVDKQGELHKGRVQFKANSVSNKVGDGEFAIDITLGGVVCGIMDEMVNDEPTGRKVLKMLSVGYGNRAIPLEFMVGTVMIDDEPVDLAEQIEDIYEVGDNVEIFATIETRTVGAKPKKVAFGKASKIVDGFEKTEYIFTGGMSPMEEFEDDNGESNLISTEQVKMLMNEREMMLSELKQKGYQGKRTEVGEQKTEVKKPVNNEVADLF